MDLSVLLPLSERPELAHPCLESLERTVPRGWRYETILTVGAGDALPAGFEDDPRHRIVRHAGSPGRPAFLNAAARVARAPVLCLLDPGTTLIPGWLEPMWKLLRREQSVGCVGNIQREPYSGLIDHAGLLFDLAGMPVPAGRGEPFPPVPRSARRPAVSAACCLVNRANFNELGGFDEGFRRRFDDVDFCLRSAGTGLRHFVAHRSVVYHLPAPVLASRPGQPEDADLRLYRSRWGERARTHYCAQNVGRRAAKEFSLERWLAAWEARRQYRQNLMDAREDGRRYLIKHLHRPWRYSYRRLCSALVQATHPLPPSIPHPPAYVPAGDAIDAFDPVVHGRDAALFAAPHP